MTPFLIRKIILEQSFRAHVGHIGSALSIADIIYTLYSSILLISSPDVPYRDRFILSNGHTALALYAALHLRGWISETELNTYCSDGTYLGTHPEHRLNGIDFCTGSLGQGLSYGAGTALAARMQKSARRSFVLISDAECNEGSLWETVMFSAHHQLSNLVAIIDLNGQQAFGYTRDVLNLSSMAERWHVFGWDVHEVDGHDPDEIIDTISGLDVVEGQPHVLIAHTTFGKWVSFMENQIKWHYWTMSEAVYHQAQEDLKSTV